MARPHSKAAQAKMLAAATELVLAAGVRGFNIDEVARRSGVAKTTIYRHFPNPNELLVAALDGAIAVPPTPNTGSLRGDLLEFLASVLPIFANPTVRALSFEIFAAAIRDPELRHLYASMMRGREGPTKTIFDRGQSRGEISPDLDYRSALEIIEGPFIIRSLVRPEALHDIDLESLVDRILKLLKA